MIAVDTSALMAIVLDEPDAGLCADRLAKSQRLLLSSGTAAEALIVAARRGIGAEMTQLIEGLGFEVVAVTEAEAHRVAAAYARWGKGAHPAGLNFGDCFAYAVASGNGCPLLYIGDDFRRTDVISAI